MPIPSDELRAWAVEQAQELGGADGPFTLIRDAAVISGFVDGSIVVDPIDDDDDDDGEAEVIN
jgi:hypothetical protein